MSSGGGSVTPRRCTPFPNGELGIVWSDGRESCYPAHALRCACPCASCIDEVTGQRLLKPAGVAKDVRVVEVHPVGNYAVSILWSDGHDTGIYTFERLRELA